MEDEVATTVDAATVFCMKAYTLEGECMLESEVYSHLQELATAATVGYDPSIARENTASRQELLTHAMQCV